jgi:hypothetical protein
MVNENYRLSYMYDNPSIPFEQGRDAFLSLRFIDWGADIETITKIQNLTVGDILPAVGHPVSWDEFRARTGIDLPIQKFTILRRAFVGIENRSIKTELYPKKAKVLSVGVITEKS